MPGQKPIGSADFVKQMFKFVDKNGDGYASTAEIKEYVAKYGSQALLGAKNQALFEKLDASDDGKLSMEGKKIFYNNDDFKTSNHNFQFSEVMELVQTDE